MENFPETIRKLTDNKPFSADKTGMSRSRVLLYPDMVLKIESMGENAQNERRMLSWLQGKLPVPEIICAEESKGMQYLLMTRLQGDMACAAKYMNDPKTLTKLLAEALHMLWQVDASGCPYCNDLANKLRIAHEDMENGLVDTENVEPETYGEGGFASPEELLHWLESNRPSENLVFSHGDLCLPNIFFRDSVISGFLDLGNAGLADPYQDIALCWRSLRHNSSGKYRPADRSYPDFDPDALFCELGMTPDMEKLRYYLLLDELS